MTTTKRCPYCAEEIQIAAIVCKHCGRELGPPVQSPRSVQRKSNPVRILIAVLVGIGGFGLCVASLGPTTPPLAEVLPLQASASFNGTQFLIKNESGEDWRNITVRINDTYEATIDQMNPRETTTLGAMAFADKNGVRFNPFSIKPLGVKIAAYADNKSKVYVGTWK